MPSPTVQQVSPNLAKITRPTATRLLERSRLFTALDQARRASATWITAPPGFGKTSLASSYVEQRGLECLWYRIDDEDADAGNFFHYLGQAGASLPHDEYDLPPFTPENLPSLGAFARRFFEILLQRLPTPAVLVFDDYQEVAEDVPLHALLAKALEHLPAGAHIMFLSREDPPPAYARARAHGVLTQLDADALKLTAEESLALATAKGSGRKDVSAVAQLNELAGGWAAGLMLLLARGDQSLPARLPDTATLQVVFDYFSQEIFRNLDPDVQSLLLQCALLPDMPGEVLRRLTGSDAAARLLDQLSAKNYFTTRHEGAAAIYRFHPLFHSFLMEQAARLLPREEFDALRQRAAHALAEAGYVDDAVVLLQVCEDWGTLAQTILLQAPTLARQGRLQTLSLWIHRLPDAVVERDPWLLYWLASSRLPVDPPQARDTFLRAYARFDANDDPTGLYLCWAGVATIYYLAWFPAEEVLAWIDAFESLQRRHPRFPSSIIESRVVVGLVAVLRLYRLSYSDFHAWLRRCESLLDTIDDHSARLMAATELAWCYSWGSEIARGASLLRETAHLTTGNAAPMARLSWLMASALYAWHFADAEACATATAEALRLADESEVHVMDTYICVHGLFGALMVDDIEAANALRSRIDNVPAKPQTLAAVSYHYFYSLLRLNRGEFSRAEYHAREWLAQSTRFGVPFFDYLVRICLASTLMEDGKWAEAGDYFEQASQLAQGFNSVLFVHLCLLGMALLSHKQRQRKEALALLAQAIECAKEGGGHYSPFFYRQSLAELYALGLEANLEADFLRNQIRCHRLAPPASAPENWPWPVKIYTLGRFAIAKDGVALKSGAKSSRKPMELLKILIAQGGRDVHQEKLVAALWPDAEGDDAHHSFETTLYRLRKLLGAEALLVKDSLVTLNPAHCWVDSWAFERLASLVDADVDADDRAAVETDSRRLLGLYQGPFLDRDHDIPLAIAYEERLRSRMLRVLDKLGRFWAARGEPAKALECYLRALEADPRAEVFYQGLMRHYHAQGRYPEAIAIYQRCRLALHSLVGVPPSTETNALYASALAAAGNSSPTVSTQE